MSPLISILIPCFNVEKFLPQCLDSVINQTYKNLQIVAIDDGSSDQTWKIMQEYAAKDSRLEICHQENQGVAATRNHLLEKIRGEYVLFVDSDDWIELDMVGFLLNQILEFDADVVNCANVTHKPPTSAAIVRTEVWDQSKVIYEFLRHVTISGQLCNKLIKTNIVLHENFPCNISYGEDALFFWGVLQKVTKVVVTNKQLYHYRVNASSISHQAWRPEKKGSEHVIWKIINDDCLTFWPQFANVAKVRYALEDMWAIYFAIHSGYKYDEHIYVRQKNVRKNLIRMMFSSIPSINMKAFACIASVSYSLCKYFKK